MIASRRSFILTATAFLAAPSIVRAASLMPMSVLDAPHWDMFTWNGHVLTTYNPDKHSLKAILAMTSVTVP